LITEFSGTVGGWIQAVALTDLVSALVDKKHLSLNGRELAPGELRLLGRSEASVISVVSCQLHVRARLLIHVYSGRRSGSGV
jgi:hypothetical protein